MSFSTGTVSRELITARNAVLATFFLNGFAFASLFSRVPDIRSGLDLDNGSLGMLLLSGALGSVLAMPTAGALIRRASAAAVVRSGAGLVCGGLVLAGIGVDVVGTPIAAAVGLFVYGIGTGVWDVSMNVEGAAVERGLGRAILPRFHAGWSLGSVTGAGLDFDWVAGGQSRSGTSAIAVPSGPDARVHIVSTSAADQEIVVAGEVVRLVRRSASPASVARSLTASRSTSVVRLSLGPSDVASARTRPDGTSTSVAVSTSRRCAPTMLPTIT